MKREIVSSYEIKLTFDFNTENPSRLFQSFAKIIEGISSYDSIIAKSINSNILSKIILDDIEKGSLIAKLMNELTFNEDEKFDTIENNEDIENYIEECRNLGLKFIEDGKVDVEDLEKLSENLDFIAKNNNIKNTFNYESVDILELAKSLNDVSNSTKQLYDEEKYSVKSKKSEEIQIDKNSQKIDIDKVEEALTEELIENEREGFYKIKKPDFLGDSQWDFKFGNKKVLAKILDEDWLEDFHSGKIVVVPGDSLKVKIKQTSRFNRNGYLISDKIEIIEVLEIKHNK